MLWLVGTTPGGSTATGARGRLGRVLTDVAQRPLKQLATWLAAVGVVLSAPFGGWADAEKPALAATAVDKVVATGPLDVTINRVSASHRPGEGFTEFKDGYYLLVFGTVKSKDKVTLRNLELRDAVRLQGVDGLAWLPSGDDWQDAAHATRAQPQTYFTKDSTTMSTVSPGLTYDVAWVFRRAGDPPPTEVDVVVHGFTWRKSNLQNVTGWMDPGPIAHVTLPVTVKPAWTKPETKAS